MVNPASPDSSRRGRVDAYSIRLADGYSWGLALPSTRLRPVVVEGRDAPGRASKTTRLVTGSGYPLEIRRLIDDLRAACDRGGPEERYEALIRLATALILRAHDVDPTVAGSLLELAVDELPGLVDAVLIVVSGACPANPGGPRKGEIDGRSEQIERGPFDAGRTGREGPEQGVGGNDRGGLARLAGREVPPGSILEPCGKHPASG